MKNKYLISALSLIAGLGLGTLTNKGLLQTKGMRENYDLPYVLPGRATSLLELGYHQPGGGGSTGDERFIRYRFSITYSQWELLKDLPVLYIGMPYDPQYNAFSPRGVSVSIQNSDDTYIYGDSNNSFYLSSSMIYQYGMSGFEDTRFIGGNPLKESTINQYSGAYKYSSIKFTMIIPLNYFDAQYQTRILDLVNFYSVLPDMDEYDRGYKDGYTDGNKDGYNDGYVNGNNDGLDTGYDNGYNAGFDAGVASDFDSFSWLTAIFSGFTAFFSIQFLPGVTIGGVAILVMTLTLLPFLIGLFKGGKD